jgi:hypothetical protein
MLHLGITWKRLVSFTCRLLYHREESPDTNCIGGWLGSRDVLDAKEKRNISRPCRESNPNSSVVQSLFTELSQLPGLYTRVISKVLLTSFSWLSSFTATKSSDGTSNWATTTSVNSLSKKMTHEWLTSIFLALCTLLHILEKLGMRTRTRPATVSKRSAVIPSFHIYRK